MTKNSKNNDNDKNNDEMTTTPDSETTEEKKKKVYDSGICSWCQSYPAERFNEATPESMYMEGRNIQGDNICRVCMLEEQVKNLQKQFDGEIARLHKELEEHLTKTT